MSRTDGEKGYRKVITPEFKLESQDELSEKCIFFFYVHVTVHRNKFLCNKTKEMH